MAPPAADAGGATRAGAAPDIDAVSDMGHAPDPAGWLRLLAPAPGRLEFAARVALICTLTVLVTQLYGTPEPALTAYVVFFLVRRDRATTLLLCLVLTLLLTVLIGIVLAVANLTLDRPPWRLASMALISFGLLFLVSASKLSAVGGTIALIVAYSLDVLGQVPVGEAATRGLLYAWLFVGIPAGVTAVVSLLLAPAPRQLVQRALMQRLRLVAATLRGGDPRSAQAFAETLREGDGEIRTWLKLAGAEHTAPAQQIAALRQAAADTAAMQSFTAFATRVPQAALPHGVRAALAQTVDGQASDLAGAASAGRCGAVDAAAAPAAASAAEAARSPRASALPAALAGRVLAAFEAVLGRFARPASAGAAVAAAAALPAGGGFLLPDAFTNSDHVRYALKTTGAAMFCYLLYSLLDWPGIHTCFLTCYIVSLGTVAESVEKLTLRLAGCLVGAALGLATLLFVVPSLTSIGGLMVAVFLGTLLAAWIAGGSPRIAYAGFQVAFAFFLCVVQGAGPAFDMVTVRDRVIGVVVGNLVAYFASAYCWPFGVSRRIESGIAGLLQRLAAAARVATTDSPRESPGEWLTALGAVENDLDLARYEPPSVRPSDAWQDLRRRIVRQIGALQVPLALLAQRGTGAGAAVVQRLERLAGVPDAPDAQDAAQAVHAAYATPGGMAAGGPNDPVRDFMDHQLGDLEESMRAATHLQESANGPDTGTTHAAA